MLAEGIATLEVWLKKQTSDEAASDEPDPSPKRKKTKRKKAKKTTGGSGTVHEL